MPDSAPRMK